MVKTPVVVPDLAYPARANQPSFRFPAFGNSRFKLRSLSFAGRSVAANVVNKVPTPTTRSLSQAWEIAAKLAAGIAGGSIAVSDFASRRQEMLGDLPEAALRSLPPAIWEKASSATNGCMPTFPTLGAFVLVARCPYLQSIALHAFLFHRNPFPVSCEAAEW